MKKLLFLFCIIILGCSSNSKEKAKDIIMSGMRSQGVPGDFAKCMSGKIVEELSDKELELISTPYQTLKGEDKEIYDSLLTKIMTDEKFINKLVRQCE
ncbi:MAG: hypothetical protein IJM31_00580 [Campylobacter sp.]|nr:hypothetical protein [Campylobacter sp.]MBQ7270446.1 hypothetical protein [Campylobacter sp.]MBQ9875567.1 hypothetical protein [Campylobacter sp.]MBR0071106.1 hypothetical protein [Campylobacter sp.]